MLNKDNTEEAPLIAVVDDDASVRYSTRRLLRAFGFRSEAFASASEFLNSGHLRHLTEVNYSIPIIFLAAGAEENERVRAMQNGAVHFLRKPASEQSLIKAIQTALTLAPCLGPEMPLAVNH
jgi:FixJ family two-component response regulator